MKTAFAFAPVLASAIVAEYGKDRLEQITRAANGALTAENVKRKAGGARWNGQISGGQSVTGKNTLQVKDTTWKETETFEYSVEGATAPLECVKFNGAFENLYKKCGGQPSGEITCAVFPKYVRAWFDEMTATAKAKAAGAPAKPAGKTRTSAPKVPPVTPPASTNGQHATANA